MRGFKTPTLGGLALGLALLVSAGCTRQQDAAINEQVRSRIELEQPTTHAEQLTITTKDRIVRLDGIVESDNARERLERAAREVTGVIAVDNRLAVRQPPQVTGATTERTNPADRTLRDR